MANPAREIRIAVMGVTGSGKSTFINMASESNLPVSRGLESCTREVQTSRPFVVSGRVVTLIDTPGFDDTTRSDTDVLSMIAACLSNTYEHGSRLAGVIYMHRISDYRMGGKSKGNFKIFRELCGESSLKNVLIVTNMWSEVKREIGEAREAELASKDKFFKPLLEKGARMLADALSSPHIRPSREIVDEHKPIEKTAAGSELRRALEEQADHHKEEIRNLRAGMEAAMRAKHEERRGELQGELEKKQQECLRIEKNSQHMAAEFVAERARLEARILQMEDEHQKQLQALEGLQCDVARVLSEKEKQESLHIQNQRDIIAAKQEEDERRTRELEEERKARALAEESLQKRLQSLQDDMEKTRTAKEIGDIAHAEEVKRERERLAALEAEQQRQSSAMEAAKVERAREEAERTRLQEEFAQREKEFEEVKASHAQEAEGAATKQAEENARTHLLEQQELARQREELARMQREMEEAYATREPEAALTSRQTEEDARVRLLAEKHEAKLREAEAHEKRLQDELLRLRREMEEAAQAEERRKQEEAAAAKKVEEDTQSHIVVLQKRSRLLEEKKNREEENRRRMEEELARLTQLVSRSEEQRANLAEQVGQKEESERNKSQQLEEELTKARERAEAATGDRVLSFGVDFLIFAFVLVFVCWLVADPNMECHPRH
ncbi:hypothetical protein EDB19DRAFT_2048203 [Suillus lakei]|nr:hypothetical protein EDB19DRAFT_2048203 [Suillus lakei]